MSNPTTRFLATLGFLSRLARARVMDDADMRRSMFHLPLCGCFIGAAVCLPAQLGLFAGRPLVQAWLTVLLSIYLTRGLHLDGLSDVADGAASHVDPERFWAIIKDSRAGAFGVAAVALALLGQTALYSEVLRALPAWTLLWVFVFGRACGVVFGWLTKHLARPGLGGLFLAGATPGAVLWALGLVASPLLCPALRPPLGQAPQALGFATLAALLLLTPLYRLSRAVAGVNGDFLGSAILLGELAAAAGLVLSLTPGTASGIMP